jgi:hypothetical protein
MILDPAAEKVSGSSMIYSDAPSSPSPFLVDSPEATTRPAGSVTIEDVP